MKRSTLTILCWLFVAAALSISIISNGDVQLNDTEINNALKVTGETSDTGNNQQDIDTQLLARCVNGEARGEPYVGQVAVAAVILNRVAHPSFPNTLSGVIYQPLAFTAVADGQINAPIAEDTTVYQACKEAMNGVDPSGGAIYYYNPEKTTNDWIYSREVIKTIGKHKFAI